MMSNVSVELNFNVTDMSLSISKVLSPLIHWLSAHRCLPEKVLSTVVRTCLDN